MDANEGVQSINFEVGQRFTSFKEFESQLKHYQDAKFIQMYRSSCKIESTKTKGELFSAPLAIFLHKQIRQIKFRMKVYNKIGTYKNKSTTTILADKDFR
jgi:hypothetical protein